MVGIHGCPQLTNLLPRLWLLPFIFLPLYGVPGTFGPLIPILDYSGGNPLGVKVTYSMPGAPGQEMWMVLNRLVSSSEGLKLECNFLI